MSATGNPSSSSWPCRYSRVRARHWVGLLTEMAGATFSWGPVSWGSESCGPAASPGPDVGSFIVRLWTIRPTAKDGLLPAAVVDDLAEGTAVRLGQGGQRPVGRVAQADQEGDVVAGRDAEDRAGPVLVADRGVAGAHAEVGRREHHGVGGLAQVVVVDQAGAVVVGLRDDDRDGGGRPGDVPGAAPHLGQRAELVRVGDDDEVPVLPVGGRRRPPGGFGDA